MLKICITYLEFYLKCKIVPALYVHETFLDVKRGRNEILLKISIMNCVQLNYFVQIEPTCPAATRVSQLELERNGYNLFSTKNRSSGMFLTTY